MIKKIVLILLLSIASSAAFAQAKAPCMPGGYITIDGQDPNQRCFYPNGAHAPHYPWQYSTKNSQAPTPIYLPSKYGAIAADMTTGNTGSSFGLDTKAQARQLALKKCGTEGCELMGEYANQCAALVTGKGTGGYTGMGYGLTRQLAESKALGFCYQETQTCWVVLSDCSLAQ